ncbi:increased loss of mitochondrial DNA protein 1 [Astrocystis sublimbata]|nr:increased loss of mitochondrial DNA protein 1 [Astrocystis sublimbata]
MALISASTILTSLCLFHVTLAYFFYTNPHTIADQAFVYVLGEAVGIPPTQYFSTPTPSSSFLAIALFIVGLSDLITLSMPEEIWLIHYWGSQAPARLVVFGFLSLFTYSLSPSNPISMSPHHHHHGYGTGTGTEGLCNRVFFAFAVIETLSWFWAWVTLREEGVAFLTRKRSRRASNARERS